MKTFAIATTLAMVMAVPMAVEAQGPDCNTLDCFSINHYVAMPIGFNWNGAAGWYDPNLAPGDTVDSRTENSCTPGLIGLQLELDGGDADLYPYYPTVVINDGSSTAVPTSIADPNLNHDEDGNPLSAGCLPFYRRPIPGNRIGLQEESVITLGTWVDPFFSVAGGHRVIGAAVNYDMVLCDPSAYQGSVGGPLADLVPGVMKTHIQIDESKCPFKHDFTDLHWNNGDVSFFKVHAQAYTQNDRSFSPDGGAGTWSGLVVVCETVNVYANDNPIQGTAVTSHDWFWLVGTAGDAYGTRDATIAQGSDPSIWGNSWDGKFDNDCPISDVEA